MGASDCQDQLDGVSQGGVAANLTGNDDTSQVKIEHPEKAYLGAPVNKPASTLDFSKSRSTSAERLVVNEEVTDKPRKNLSTWETFVIIMTLTGITITSCMSTGAFTIGLPVIARDLNLADNFMLW